jgi:hypothetical protein
MVAACRLGNDLSVIDLAATEGAVALFPTGCEDVVFGAQAFNVRLSRYRVEATQFLIEGKQPSHRDRLAFIQDQFPAGLVGMRVIAQRWHTPHPETFLLGGGNLVSNTFRGHFPFELGKGQQDIQGEPPHGGGGVEGLGDGDKGTPGSVQLVHQFCKIGQGSCEAIDLVDHDHVDAARPDITQQLLQGRALQGAAGLAAIVIPGVEQLPAFMLLAGNIGDTGLMLRIQRIEVLLQPVI